MANLPALRPQIRRASATAAMSSMDLCQRLPLVEESEAWALIQVASGEARRQGMSSEQICTELTRLRRCRAWARHAGDFDQYIARFGCSSSSSSSSSSQSGTPSTTPCGGPGKCDCEPCKSKDPMNQQTTPNPSIDWSSSCGGYRQPDPSGDAIVFANSCEAAMCQGGTRVGLEMIPYQIELVPGVSQTLTFGFTRSSRVVAISFTRKQSPSASYNPDDITINNWRTSATMQAYDLPRQNTSFAGIDPNTVPVPLTNYFEDGDDAFSPILHGMNPIPRLIPPFDIGSNDGLVQFDIELDAALASNQTAFFWLWTVFTGTKKA